jgi:peroxiredoxin
MAGGSAWIAFKLVTVDKRVLFASLAVAAAVVTTVGIAAAMRGDSTDPIDDVTISTPGDLSPTIGTNAVLSGRSIPALDIRTVDGNTLSTANLLGRPLVINLWYSTCGPCKRELPAFAEAHAVYGDTVRFVGINPSALEPKSEDKFARDKGVQYELYYDPDGEIASQLGIATMPQTLFVDTSGKILDQTGELTAEKLEELIRATLL